jgi:C-terminal processing protease CtpA/Prc
MNRLFTINKQVKRLLIPLISLLLSITSCKSIKSSIKASDTITKQEVLEIFEITEKNICNPAFVQSKQWEDFKKELLSEENLKLDRLSFEKKFNKQRKSLPFTHYYLKLNKKSKKIESEEKEAFELTKLSDKTMLLTIRFFSAEAKKINTILNQLRKTNYSNLIIDLRENRGGTLNAVVPLVQYLSSKLVHGGYFLSRAWFDQHKDYPTNEQLKKFTPLMDPTYRGFTKKMQKDMGMSLIIPPNGKPTFKGKIYILTSTITGSACEPLVFGLKYNEIGTIVGQKTAGAMLSGYTIKVNELFSLFIPIADYVTVTNQRIDKVGVKPDIKVQSEEALDYVINRLIIDKR